MGGRVDRLKGLLRLRSATAAPASRNKKRMKENSWVIVLLCGILIVETIKVFRSEREQIVYQEKVLDHEKEIYELQQRTKSPEEIMFQVVNSPVLPKQQRDSLMSTWERITGLQGLRRRSGDSLQ
jgi:hypothetical protein